MSKRDSISQQDIAEQEKWIIPRKEGVWRRSSRHCPHVFPPTHLTDNSGRRRCTSLGLSCHDPLAARICLPHKYPVVVTYTSDYSSSHSCFAHRTWTSAESGQQQPCRGSKKRASSFRLRKKSSIRLILFQENILILQSLVKSNRA